MIDDELSQIELLKFKLDINFPKYNVLHFKYPERFEKDSIDIKQEVALILLDIMFVGDKENGQGGFNRGLEWYEVFKTSYPTVPVIILTNIKKNKISDDNLILIENNGDKLFQKTSKKPSELVLIIKKLIGNR